MTDSPSTLRRYSPELAARALRRAARLQVEAAERTERQSGPGPAGEQDEGLGRRELVEAAREAGIDEEFMAVALAEVDGDGITTAMAQREDKQDSATTRWLGTTQRNVLVSKVIDGSPAEVWVAIGQIFEAEACGLKLKPLTEGHPTTGGVAHFEMPTLQAMVSSRAGAYTQLCYRMEQLEMRRLGVKLRDLGSRTEVTLYCDLRAGAAINLKWARGCGWVLGLAAGGGGVLVGATTSILAAAGFGVLGLVGGIAGVVAMWRPLYRSALHNLEIQLEALLGDVQAHLQRADVYRLPAADLSNG
ncbi:MAG: hypothetical protein K0V04_45980 [Deltaproteobacteria bacterium]|nr:hypothetical protein [Deltaproteobacteria bacterium]